MSQTSWLNSAGSARTTRSDANRKMQWILTSIAVPKSLLKEKEALLREYAAKHKVSFDLVSEVLEMERGHLNESRAEVTYRRDRIREMIEAQVKGHDH